MGEQPQQRGEDAAAPGRRRGNLKGFEEKEVTLRWLKPYVSAAEYKLLMTKIPEGTIQWIKKQLEDPDITVGESSASADS
ncbi:hypothetical protein [Gordonia westfalica]|uniref:hypothetical protein n=1 Tax=Gordonia westfalica TaxID=158898 RepID=UPI0011132D2D|nr:hypothetical protein [Gordonia westfalica]